jgi:hypothetical protein
LRHIHQLEGKWDAKLEQDAQQWIADLLHDDTLRTPPLQPHLKNGSVLCRMLNAIKEGTVSRFVAAPSHVLEERENILSYLHVSPSCSPRWSWISW